MFTVFVQFILYIVCYTWFYTTFLVYHMGLSVRHHISNGVEVIRIKLLLHFFLGQPIEIRVAKEVVFEVSLTRQYSAFEEEDLLASPLERSVLIELWLPDPVRDWHTANHPGVHIDTRCIL